MRLVIILLLICIFSSYSSHREKIALIGAPCFDRALMDTLTGAIQKTYGKKAVYAGVMNWPKTDSVYVTRYLEDMLFCWNEGRDYKIVVGLTTHIIYGPDRIYGSSYENYCIVSDYQILCTHPYIPSLTHVVLHEVGHSLGLEHCSDSTCIMQAFDHLDNLTLCPKCKKLLHGHR